MATGQLPMAMYIKCHPHAGPHAMSHGCSMHTTPHAWASGAREWPSVRRRTPLH